MYTFFTAAIVSILALASSLAVVVRAGEPRVVCDQMEPIRSNITTCTELLLYLNQTEADLMSINPRPSCLEVVESRFVCILGDFPACKTKVTADGKDTDCNCDALAEANHITKQQFIDWNDDVDAKDCSGVVPGHTYCVAIPE